MSCVDRRRTHNEQGCKVHYAVRVNCMVNYVSQVTC